MPERLTCPHGHQWEAYTLSPVHPGHFRYCPYCAAPLAVEVPRSSAGLDLRQWLRRHGVAAGMAILAAVAVLVMLYVLFNSRRQLEAARLEAEEQRRLAEEAERKAVAQGKTQVGSRTLAEQRAAEVRQA